VPQELTLESIEGLQPAAVQELPHPGPAQPTLPLPSLTEEIRRHDCPDEDTPFPVEYAFHLLGGIAGRTVVDLGCRSGVTSVILASLGARVLAMDSSESNLQETERRARAYGVLDRVRLIHVGGRSIPAADASTDRVLCQSILQSSEPRVIARQIRRILRPGGRAVFHDIVTPAMLHGMIDCSRLPVSKDFALSVSRAVGVPGRFREFWVTTGILRHLGVPSSSPLARVCQRIDAALLRRFPLTRALASSFVWDARKEG